MSLVARKPRPLTRDATTFRDDRLFIVACDDIYAPKQYFVGTTDGTSVARHVLKGEARMRSRSA